MGTIGTLVILGLVIGSNNLAVALALGAHGQGEHRARIALVFGAFEFAVPLVGIWLGATAARRIGTVAGTIGAVLFIAIGGWTVASGIRDHWRDDRIADSATTWRGLMLLAAGLSLDNLLVGFSLGLGNADPLAVASTIAVFAVAFTLGSISLGARSARHWEQAAKIGAGALLTALGCRNGDRGDVTTPAPAPPDRHTRASYAGLRGICSCATGRLTRWRPAT